jgi:hypothetical protein
MAPFTSLEPVIGSDAPSYLRQSPFSALSKLLSFLTELRMKFGLLMAVRRRKASGIRKRLSWEE